MDFSIQNGFRLGDFEVYPQLNRLTSDGVTHAVEGKIMAVLVELAKEPYVALSKNALLDSVWPNQQVAEGVLTRAIYELRQVMHDDASNAHYIETVPRLGYRLVCQPRALNKPLIEHDARKKWLAVAAVLTIVLAVVWLSAYDKTMPNNIRSVAVMPLENITGSVAKNYIGDGLAEAIIHTIAQQPDLRVIARTSSFALRDSGLTAKEIGARLNVTNLFEGSIREERGVQRITIQLIDTSTGLHYGSESFDVVHGDLFAAQERIGKIVEMMLRDSGASIRASDGKPATATVGQAYELVLKGRAALHNRSTESLRNARVFFEEALTLDPQFAAAHAGLAQFYLISHAYLDLDFQRTKMLASRSSSAALALDANNVNALMVAAAVAADSGNYESAVKKFKHAVTLQPGNAQAQQWYGEVLITLGYLSDGRDRIKTALRLNPLAGSTVSVRAKAAVFFLDDEQLLSMGTQGNALGARLAPRELAVHYFRIGDAISYQQQLSQYHELIGVDSRAAGWLADALDKKISSIELLNRLAPLGIPKDNYFAREFALLGLHREALERMLQGAGTEGSFLADIWLPEFKESRALPQFSDYLESLEFDRYWRAHGPPDVCRQVQAESFCRIINTLNET